ncbi:Gfo/Idh/MocA family protein [Falsiroseomonas sp.]|uniref:Gfo/Idh/MocA family oxidoreductase n=1 Tax=Falsiroseomonas sp. TaxID=2870721 RepID=UPI002718FB70|nr:Gfo/Idh/MocA family oxidoreductase [Falsiroseomonas sp.]MDO9501682.1 Gfo/Idh/MocA family oxidoreductase [Falsiroseomonas sp.]
MTRLLLLGCGAFGRIHLAALARLGFDLGQDVAVLEPDAAMRAAAPPGTRFVRGLDAGLRDCDAAIIATPPATHAALAEAVLRAGRDLFLEKPATETAAQSAALHDLATGRIVQLGLYFRFHPKAQAIHRLARAGGFGRIHHLSARMSGLKRARGDSGALLNDAVHFADLLPWIAGEAPSHVFATLSDPLGRGREDLAVIQLRFPSGATALIEAGCVLPGEHADAVVPGAETRKLLAVAGNAALAEVDFMAETLRLRRGAHHPARRNDPGGAWLPDHAPAEDLGAGALDPVGVVAAQLSAFLQAVRTRVNHGPDLHEGGVLPLRILDAARRSAHGMRVEELT